MLYKTGLLIVSNPKHIGKILSTIEKRVKTTLYIQLQSALNDPFGHFYANKFTSWPKFSQTIFKIYSQAATHCNNLDVRLLLSGLKYDIANIKTQNPIDLIIFDRKHPDTDIDAFIKARIGNITKEYAVVTVDTGEFQDDFEINENDDRIFSHSVLGGTFDRLHIAHKLLLSEAALRSKEKVTVGITEENMIQSKMLWELIEPVQVRLEKVHGFLQDICSELSFDVVKIADPYGPAIVDPTMEMIVVSKETVKGGQKINQIRSEKGLKNLAIVPIELVDEPDPQPNEETKISSSNGRIRLLGTVFNPIEPKSLPKRPYIIGLTGGIASGKSGVARYMNELGALVIDCDKIGHQIYAIGKPCYFKLIQHFGEHILSSSKEIDRKVLGGIVFSDPNKLKALNEIVWPEMAKEIQDIIKSTDKEIVVVEAAVLLQAGWQNYCHEVWTTLVPENEAVNRLINRNKLTEDQAKSRIHSQAPNKEYVSKANVIFCTLWEPEITRLQVIKAWGLLQNRI